MTAKQGVNAHEFEKFARMADRWWDADGPMRPLHLMNPLRIAWILERAAAQFGCRRGDLDCLRGLDILDVGCGAGLLSEPMCRLGGRVTGIDGETAVIDAARAHARTHGLEITYGARLLDDLIAERARFDLVLAMEVIEHVEDQADFVRGLAAVTKPGGLVVLSTLSRTIRSFLVGIVAAEYLLRWLPPGTHAWNRFVTPASLARLLRAHGFRPLALTGVAFDAAHDRFKPVRDPGVNYMMAAVRTG